MCKAPSFAAATHSGRGIGVRAVGLRFKTATAWSGAEGLIDDYERRGWSGTPGGELLVRHGDPRVGCFYWDWDGPAA